MRKRKKRRKRKGTWPPVMEGYFYKGKRKSKYKRFWRLDTWFRAQSEWKRSGYKWCEKG